MSGKLYVVGTPIGNLEDFSPRAIRILSEVDFIAAEDTRVTLRLLNHFEIKKPLISYFEHNKFEQGATILARLNNGETAAIVTDAGMPAISDPGEDLVRECIAAGIAVESVPGPVAFATALSVSGMPSRRFCFEGFLSVDKKERRAHLEEIKKERRTMIFYEAPHKLCRTLEDLYAALGERKISVCRELTKLHEQVISGTITDAIEHFKQNAPRGEFVLIIEGKTQSDTKTYTLEDAVNMAKALQLEGLSASAAAREAASVTGIKKGDIYKFMLEK